MHPRHSLETTGSLKREGSPDSDWKSSKAKKLVCTAPKNHFEVQFLGRGPKHSASWPLNAQHPPLIRRSPISFALHLLGTGFFPFNSGSIFIFLDDENDQLLMRIFYCSGSYALGRKEEDSKEGISFQNKQNGMK